MTTRKLFFQTGFEEGKAVLASAGEELMPGVSFTLKAFNTKTLSVKELFACNNLQSKYKVQMAEMWNSTVSKTTTGRPIDAILCPSSAVVGSPHDTPGYVGYTSLFNILDYPAATIPWKTFKVSEAKDPKNAAYRPMETNPYDSLVHQACECSERSSRRNVTDWLAIRRPESPIGATDVVAACGKTVRGRGDDCCNRSYRSHLEPGQRS